ncbi:hypothetical protein GCM10027161_27290 [Microbispora hainanensis]
MRCPTGFRAGWIETGDKLTVEGVGEVVPGGVIVSHHRDGLTAITGQLTDDLALHAVPAAVLDDDGRP